MDKLGLYINNLMTSVIDREEKFFLRKLAFGELHKHMKLLLVVPSLHACVEAVSVLKYRLYLLPVPQRHPGGIYSPELPVFTVPPNPSAFAAA